MPQNRTSKSNEELRREHRAERREQQRMRRRIFYVALSLVVIVIGVVLSLTVFFNITTIYVEGNTIYSEKDIIAASGLEQGDNLFLISRDKARTNVTEKLPFAHDVEFENKLPGTIIIKVYDTCIRCAVETADGYILIDGEGKVLGEVETLEEISEYAVKLEEYKGVGKAVVFPSVETVKDDSKENKKETVKESEKETAKTDKQTNTENETSNVEKGIPAKYVIGNKDIILLKGVEVTEVTPGMPLAVGNDKKMELYQEIMKTLTENEIEGINEINLEDTFSVSLWYQGRIEILVGSVSNLESKLALCKEIIVKQNEISPYQKGTIDLTIDKQGYFSPYVEPTTQAPPPLEAVEYVTDGSGEPVTNEKGEKVTVASNENTSDKDEEDTTKTTSESTTKKNVED